MKQNAEWPYVLLAIALPSCLQAGRSSQQQAEPLQASVRGLALLQRSAELDLAAAHPISLGGTSIQRFGVQVDGEVGLVREEPLPALMASEDPEALRQSFGGAAAEPQPRAAALRGDAAAPPLAPSLLQEAAFVGAPSREAQEEMGAWEAARMASMKRAEGDAIRKAQLAGAGEQAAVEWMALQLREQARAASMRRAEAEAEAAIAEQEAVALEARSPPSDVGEVHGGPPAGHGASIGTVALEGPPAAAPTGGDPARSLRAATPWAARRPPARADGAPKPPAPATAGGAASAASALPAPSGSPAVAAAPPRRGSPGRWAIAGAAALLAVAAAALLLAAGKASAWPLLARSSEGSVADALVRSLPRSTAEEVRGCFADCARFDCSIAVPASSRRRHRIEAMVAAPARGSAALEAPLTRRSCVLYSASASRGLHDGALPVPVAFASGSQSFLVTLADDPQVRIEVDGKDVSLFCAREGQTTKRRTFAGAPDHWQDFVLTHRAAALGSGGGTSWQASSALRADASALEFQECCLPVGAVVTLVGELCRGADGALSLRPLQGDGAGPEADPRQAQDGWRTSWERPPSPPGRGDGSPTSSADAAYGRRVLVSDDPSLLQHRGP